ncbi:MAG: hypothetical protein COB02_06715 [Candidatus Cloacimonadota bacterium]|nr:MAG: hypothetical protein COB02_06715 [Candidatus Cloacimonadota bacterium]
MEQSKRKVLLVEEENTLRSTLGMFLEKGGFGVAEVADSQEAVSCLEKGIFELVVCDLNLSGKDGLWLLRHICKEYPETRVMMMSENPDIETVVMAMKSGAVDFLTKPFTPPVFIERCEEALKIVTSKTVEKQVKEPEIKPVEFAEIVGRSFTVKKMKDVVRRAANLPTTILLTGQSGTGKETTAQRIHESACSNKSPFVVVDCSSLEDPQREEEFFGSSEDLSSRGCGELLLSAKGGTIYLNEISALPERVQGKLLRILENGKVRPVGSVKEIDLKIRFICSSSKDVEQLVNEEGFRQDLFFRISGLHLKLESLKDRSEDIPAFMEYFLKGMNVKHQKQIRGYSKGAYNLCMAYHWPGNIRELKNAVERSVIFCNDPFIQEAHVPQSVREPRKLNLQQQAASGFYTLRELEKIKILETLEAFGGNKAMTAKVLGIGRNTLWRKLKEYDIES